VVIKYILKVLIVFVWLLSPLLATAQEEKLKAIGIGGAIYYFPSEFINFFIGSFEWKFSRHWSVQPEVIIFPSGDELHIFPSVFISYYFNFDNKYNLSPYLSIGGGGWVWNGEGGLIAILGIRAGIRKIIVKNSKYAWAFKLGAFFPYGIGVYTGLELCIF